MAAVNAKAMAVMARPYVSGAPEVEALLRLKAEGLRVEEVAVHMRERASGESKLQGKKAVKLVLTVIGTLLFFRWLRRRRRVSGSRAPRVDRRARATPTAAADALHPVCAARLARAAELSTADDVVVLSGWARVPGTRSEAAADGGGLDRRRRARSSSTRTRGRPSRTPRTRSTTFAASGAREVVVVTSRWHARRAKAAFRWLLRGSGVRVTVGSRRRSRANARAALAGAGALARCFLRSSWAARRS